MAEKAQENLVFAVNGKRFELKTVDPSTTLLEFLRTRTRYTGAKLGCGEGGCGACVVLLSTYDPKTDQVNEFTVSSCLTLLCSINLCSVTTTEGLGNLRDGFHPIHLRFAGFHASQCGFCTPGMCMSLYSAIINADKSERPEPPNGFSKLTVSEAKRAVAGNLCRCTGYRPIVDACKSFAVDVDLEDLGLNSFWKKGEKDANLNSLPYYKRGEICTFPDFLMSEIKSASGSLSNSLQVDQIHRKTTQLDPPKKLKGCWYRPNRIDELYEVLSSTEFNEGSVKMVVGNTGTGYFKEHDLCDKYIDLKGIPELAVINLDSDGIEIGSAVTISRAINILKEDSKSFFSASTMMAFTEVAHHMNKIASQSVRNTASLGGNLIMAQRNQFPSDIATLFLALGSKVSVKMPSERLILTLEDFLKMPPCDKRTLLVSVYIPSCTTSKSTASNANDDDFGDTKEPNLLFRTFRAAPRPLGNALAYLNAAFLAQFSLHEPSGDIILDELRLAFGAFGGKNAIRARKVENFLVGKSITASTLFESIHLVREIITPAEGTDNAAYRSSLGVAFLFRFFRPLLRNSMEIGEGAYLDMSNVSLHCGSSGSTESDYLHNRALSFLNHDQTDDHELLLSSKQVVGCNMDYSPVGEPIKKVGAEIQASGEAIYVDDIPSPKGCLHGAFVYSTRPLVRIENIEFKSTAASQKIVAFVSAEDIPKGGINIGSSSIFGCHQLFADSLVQYAGEPLGVVIAETQRYADLGAKQVSVNYSTENLGVPILTVEEAVRRSSFFEVPSFIYPKQVGDFFKGMAEAEERIISEVKLGSQYYFYMEPQTALAIPDEDNCIVVYSSSQTPEYTQGVIAKCLGIPNHNVRVITRRVGGGFGGKAIRAMPVATACALAAYKMQQPVRMYLDRKTDMVIAGGRHPMKVNYSVGFKSNGKVTALHIDLLINAGISKDISPMMPHNIIAALKKYNWGALSFDVKVCKTNLSSKSAMRAPGEVQGSYIAEAIIEEIASYLSIDATSIRERNIHTYESLCLFHEGSSGETCEYTLPIICSKLIESACFEYRVERAKRFNDCNKWRKRGISWLPIVHPVLVRPTPGKVSILADGSIVVEVGGIELGQGLWTKVKQMTAFALGELRDDRGQALVERVRVIQADSLSLVQGGFTAGSTTSESSCEAVRVACAVLVDRLKPIKDALHEQSGSVEWDALISQATLAAVNLSASTFWVPDLGSMSYLNYGAAVSEVEVDLLTGSTTILQTDLIYDCGQSLNLAVDLGQIEGAFVQGIGFFMFEEYLTNSDGLVISEGTWSYKIPTVDTIPKQFNVEILNSGHHQKRVLSSKASGEPPLLLAASVHCATREAIRAARRDLFSCTNQEGSPSNFQLDVPATMPVVKELCGLDNVERYLEKFISSPQPNQSPMSPSVLRSFSCKPQNVGLRSP